MLKSVAAFSSMCQSASSWLASTSSPSIVPTMASVSYYAQQSNIVHPSTTITTRQRSSRSKRGLYDGKDVRFGNNVPFSMKKTRRKWNPNLQYKRVYSEVLDEMIPFHLTTSALRSIDKYGGLDEYLLRSKHVSTKGEGEGQRARNRIIQTMKHRESLKQQAVERGESVEDWDKIVLVGKKIKQPTLAAESGEDMKEESLS